MEFWIVAAFILAACIAVMAVALRTRPEREDPPDVAIYRDQMKELERDAARGTLGPEEAQAARAEVARRLLAADRAAGTAKRRESGRFGLGLVLIAVPVVAVASLTYWRIGAPGYPDLPLAERIARVEAAREARPGQATAEADVPDRIDRSDPQVVEMAAQLTDVLRDRPDDLRGWRLAVSTQMGIGDFETAWRAQNRVVAILGDGATGEDLSLLAELMIFAAGGYVSPEAERAIREALRRDPGDGTARYYAGLMYKQGGRPDLAFRIWRSLLADSPEGAPWLAPIYAQIEDVSVRAGEPTPIAELPRPGAAGPTADDIAAVEDLSAQDRIEMIGGMVDGLATRLAAEGGPPSDWARLITSYGVLGRGAAAAQVYAEAQTVFADNRDALDLLARAAENAGIAP
ncbi:cytochrome c-type biogenesis protein CcmI [Jannaschia seosinensis]|uniref:Cytochrome c-type biogenesis protein CcmI n=1 Tax=Jannaschia seosinensis TaxID=313367 RepID=A0A0M7B8E6_9RHOB|nr:c-type cytochrome biogenesis protein CcmI [Jannaschia seosinensis]CUH39057.1 cytochrome c-type biogenesis protein CcmI [Jannaschia seosinensis]